jgi:hypothetical protein
MSGFVPVEERLDKTKHTVRAELLLSGEVDWLGRMKCDRCGQEVRILRHVTLSPQAQGGDGMFICRTCANFFIFDGKGEIPA